MFAGKGMEMMLKSILTSMGVDANKIESCLDAGTGFFQRAESTIQRIESKLDLILSRTEPHDNETSVAYVTDDAGNLQTETGDIHKLLTS